jgi:hypothetical protein
MSRISIAAAALAILLLAAPAASARPADLGYPTPEADKPMVMPERITDHPAESPGAKRQDFRSADAIDSATQAELRARGRDGMQTGSLAGTTEETARALAQERTYSTYGEPEPIKAAPVAVADDDGTPWGLIAAGAGGIALLFGAAVMLVVRPRRVRVAA